MDAEGKRSRGVRVAFAAIVLLLVYVVVSVAIAINTVDKCGDESDSKHWSFSPMDDSWQLFPPEWICDEETLDF